jgi:hypothetical protein
VKFIPGLVVVAAIALAGAARCGTLSAGDVSAAAFDAPR